MICLGELKIDDIVLGDMQISSAYIRDELVWANTPRENLWKNTYVSKQFLNNSGQSAASVNGDKFEAFYDYIESGTTYRFTWNEVKKGSIGNAPIIRVCFFDAYNTFISPRITYSPDDIGSGRFTVNVPQNAAAMDVRIDDVSSDRKQHFVDFQMFKL